MSIQSKLYVDDKVFEILRSSFSYHQNCDSNNRPHGKVFGGLFEIVLESTRDDIFTEWATHPTMMKNAKIVRTPIAMNGKSRTFELIDTVCIFDQNNFNATGNEPMKNFITLSSAILKLNGVLLHEKYWKVTDLSTQNVTPTVIENEDEQKVIRQYITDENDIELKEYHQGDKIFYVIETQNMTGEEVNINLKDKAVDFLYQGKRLKDDIIKNYVISSELDKVPLEVISEDHQET